jgi:hypothetical protein
MRILKNRKGEISYIDIALIALFSAMAIALAFSFVRYSTQKMTAQNLANFAERQISETGEFSGDTIQALYTVAGENHFSITVQTDSGDDQAIDIGSSQFSISPEDIQFGEHFTVTISSVQSSKIGINGLSTYLLNAQAMAGGVGETYDKE